MTYLLDTNICIYIIKRKPPGVIRRFQEISFGSIAVSSITVAELEYGSEKSFQRDRNKKALLNFLLPLEILLFDQAAAMEYGKIRTSLERKGTPIGSMDLLIAAHAVSTNLIMVTNNEKEFRRIDGLAVENWVNLL